MSDANDRADRPARRAEIGQESRDRILDAAERLFTEVGVEKATFAAIQREAGISRGSIPWHFKNKEGLLQAIVDRAMMVMASIEAAGDDSLDELLARASAAIRTPQAAFLSTLLSEATRPDSPNHERYVEQHAAMRRLLASAIADEKGAAQSPGLDVDACSTVVLGAIIGIHLQWRLAPELVDLDDSMAALGRLLHAALRTR